MTVECQTKNEEILLQRAEAIRSAIPEGGLFAEKAWRVSPIPFPLEKKMVKALERLGPVLLKFQQSCDLIYRRSKKGTLPSWVSGYLDAGKPPELLEKGLSAANLDSVPSVIRPDLILTDDGYVATELDSVPGGIGLTAWLEEVYSRTNPNCQLVGGEGGMLKGFASLFEGDGADILVSEESADYRPEMEWLSDKLGGSWKVHSAETYQVNERAIYRFFELFDLPNIASGEAIMDAGSRGDTRVISPFKPWIEEKMWAALFWSHPLKDIWRRELRDGNFQRLRSIFPRSWVVDPAEVPHHAVIPGLDIQHFSEMKQFSQSERDLVLKLSGFNERAWGSKSVTIGQDVSQEDWGSTVDEAIGSFGTAPFVLQEFHRGRLVEHPWVNDETGKLEVMEGRVRLCPYYFVAADGKTVSLGGILATICPSDKKILHGMRDAILVPCCVV